MHVSSIVSALGLASLVVASPVQVAERQTQKLRISRWKISSLAIPLHCR